MYEEGNPAELVTQAAGGVEDGEHVDDQKTKEQLIKQIVNQLSEKAANQRVQPPLTNEDSCFWALIGKLCKEVQFHYREADWKENALM